MVLAVVAISGACLMMVAQSLVSSGKAWAAKAAGDQEIRTFADLSHTHDRLGWFLLEWENGRLETAREILANEEAASPNAPETLAMAYLLDENADLHTLLRRLGLRNQPLGHFVAGERLLKRGEHEAALRAFEAALVPGQEGRYNRFCRQRIAQIRAHLNGSGTSSEDQNDAR
jgi:hypothetical protein